MKVENSSQGIGIRIAAGSITITGGTATATAITAMTAIGIATAITTATKSSYRKAQQGIDAGLIVSPAFSRISRAAGL